MKFGLLRIAWFHSLTHNRTDSFSLTLRLFNHYIKKLKQEQAPEFPGLASIVSESADAVNLMFTNLQRRTFGPGSAVFNLDPVSRTEAVSFPGMDPKFPQGMVITNPHLVISHLQHKRFDRAGANCNGMHGFLFLLYDIQMACSAITQSFRSTVQNSTNVPAAAITIPAISNATTPKCSSNWPPVKLPIAQPNV